MRLGQKQTAPRRTILFWLNCLVLVCVIPAVAITMFIVAHSFNQERAGLERDLVGTARAFIQAVDAELVGARSALFILAGSSYLASEDLARFYKEAQRALNEFDGANIILVDIDGQQLINARQPFGPPLPRRGNREQHRRVIETGRPVISDLFIGAVTKKPLVSVEVPVLVDGKPKYGLAMSILPERLNKILRRQKMPADWVVSIVDNNETIVARTLGGDEVVGEKITRELRQALKAAREGAFEGVSREGVSVLSSFSRSETSGWTVAIGIPKAGLFNVFQQAIYGNILAAYVLLVAGVLLAGRISARIAGSIRALRESAVSVGSPGQLTVPDVSIQEVNELGQSLIAAHQLVEQRTTERNDLRRRIMKAHEEERLRLAHDLHDQTGQSISAAILDLKEIEPFVEEKGLHRVRLLCLQLNQIGQMLHRIAWELRPASINELGLSHALENYLEEWSAQYKIKADFHSVDANLDQRPDEIRTTLYRVVQEALTNVAKHAANATHVSVGITASNGTLNLTIEDNGRGFDTTVSSPRLGLAGMRERLLLVGGHLKIESAPNGGTTLFARIPLALERIAA